MFYLIKHNSIVVILNLLAALFWLNGSAFAGLQCYDCHGTRSTTDIRPVDATFRNNSTGGFSGNHRNHVSYGVTAIGCQKCHPASPGYASDHGDGKISLSTNINSSTHPAKAVYSNSSSAVYLNYTTIPISNNKTGRYALGACSNVNCHFENTTPVWGSPSIVSPNNCNICHGIPPSGGVTGIAGSHGKHGTYYSGANQCVKCHTDHLIEPEPFIHATSAGRHPLAINLKDPLNNPSGSYDGLATNYLPSQVSSFGTCSNLYCHSNAAPFDKTNVNTNPTWGGAPLDCAGCHDGGTINTGLSGRHASHTTGFYTFTCERCHNDTVTGNSVIKNTLFHVNKVKDVTFKNGGVYDAATRSCNSSYCHSNAAGGAPRTGVNWADNGKIMTCNSCHQGRTIDSTIDNCNSILGVWSSSRNECSPKLTMSSNGHQRLVGPQWIRKYACYYCHNNTTDSSGNIKDSLTHVNGTKDVSMAPQWNIDGKAAASYNQVTKVCDNVYCHSDGTTNPENVRPFAWTAPKTECNTCHGHPTGSCSAANCHDGRTDINNKVWTIKTGWPVGSEWMGAMPMYPNQGAALPRANSHPRHVQTDFTCDICHNKTIKNGNCISCHNSGIPTGSMGEVAHIDPFYHVDKKKSVYFKDMPLADYNSTTKTCSGITCHSGVDPVWGGSVSSVATCMNCHGNSILDRDNYNQAFSGFSQAKINTTQFYTTGHGRYSSAGRYPVSGNPAANFPGNNPCWYCHDNTVLHKDANNPFRLRKHLQFEKRFDKECVYCHMQGIEEECLGCHNAAESLAPQLSSPAVVTLHSGVTQLSGCGKTGGCHTTNTAIHKTNSAKFWTSAEKLDVKNQYLMMGVCLQCHDDDSGGQCTSCHTSPPENPMKYSLGFDPKVEGSRFIKPKKARSSGTHFGYKHFAAYTNEGIWRGGKFCWDCHDPHGDSNIFMIHDKVATTTDGKFGIPQTRAAVIFTNKQSGTDYARTAAPFNGICNVCHVPGNKHYTSNSGDGHNTSRICTGCHEHKFTTSHADNNPCNTCHLAKPVPKHTAFGLPRDCTKCHSGTIGKRMDIMGQMNSNSHHVQGVEVTNKHCYRCHWESTPEGLINTEYHGGYNYKNYSSAKNDKVDLVIYGAGVRPTVYRNVSTAEGRATSTTFLASNMGTAEERTEIGKITLQCVSCHSDQNNDTTPFDDCKTPRQYAWDFQSIASRYLQMGIATFGKYVGTTNAAKKNISKAFSAHGNAVNNGGGFDPTTGTDGVIPNTRAGSANVQCFDCHNSHGSKVVGVTSSYVTYNGTRNGANLKETKKNIGGYTEDYKAAGNTSGVNPFGAGAGQCFDCHNSENAGTVVPNGKTPWGYSSTFGATAPITGYKDTPRFGDGVKASTANHLYRDSHKTIVGGHLKASEPAGSLANLARDFGTASTGTTTTLEDSGKSWSVNGLAELYLLIGSGSNNGQLRRIISNTATTITTEPFAADIAGSDTYKIVPYSATINGLCTPCHDPHGISQTLGANQGYALPLLKGTWMTSPYKEDTPPPDPTGSCISGGKSWGTYSCGPYPTQPTANYNIDRVTFGGATRISETDEKFAGLCMRCHKKTNLTDGVNKNQNFKTVDRVHEAVKGWGANTEHSYTCSKCHQPHSSGLPRLMQTNCLNANHRGGRVSGGLPWSADSQAPYSAHSDGNQHRGYPMASTLGNSSANEVTTSCHAGAPLNSGSWPDKNLWNNVTPW